MLTANVTPYCISIYYQTLQPDDQRLSPHQPLLIHCAHGRGRSTTVMCAALVRAGHFDSWQVRAHRSASERHSSIIALARARKQLNAALPPQTMKRISTCQAAFAFIRTKRPCVRLNAAMQGALEEWQRRFAVTKTQ